MNHTEACRKRIESEMQKDPVLSCLLRKVQDRMDLYLSQEVERGAKERRTLEVD